MIRVAGAGYLRIGEGLDELVQACRRSGRDSRHSLLKGGEDGVRVEVFAR